MEEVALIRGQAQGFLEPEQIRNLQKILGVKQQKTMSVLGDSRRYESCVLDIPLGLFYTRITLPYSVIRNPLVCEAWDTNPIEEATVFEIPTKADLGMDRVERALSLTLGFAKRSYSDMLATMLKVKWRVEKLTVVGVEMDEQQLKQLKLRTQIKEVSVK